MTSMHAVIMSSPLYLTAPLAYIFSLRDVL